MSKSSDSHQHPSDVSDQDDYSELGGSSKHKNKSKGQNKQDDLANAQHQQSSSDQAEQTQQRIQRYRPPGPQKVLAPNAAALFLDQYQRFTILFILNIDTIITIAVLLTF
ncbi:hypothetical protein BGZ93_008908 [Podila epicladia]|nr:hypothetical protein BGZ92_004436 [Podila epicladia]KAG0091262.1 hypothetical protein BGZ93_008908 [Podila epicladia]